MTLIKHLTIWIFFADYHFGTKTPSSPRKGQNLFNYLFIASIFHPWDEVYKWGSRRFLDKLA